MPTSACESHLPWKLEQCAGLSPRFVLNADDPSQVWINQYNLLNNNVPFGGKKQSGIGSLCWMSMNDRIDTFEGRELGSYALEEYTSVKAIHWNFGETLDWPL